MNYDQRVNELLIQYTLEENWKRKLGLGAAALGAGAMALAGGLKDKQKPSSGGEYRSKQPQQTEVSKSPMMDKAERLRRIAAAEALSKGEEPAPRYSKEDQSPQAKRYHEVMRRIEAGKAISQGKDYTPRYSKDDNSPEAQRYHRNMQRIKAAEKFIPQK
jgi:hypothetical protein